jgi:hypothetical protein
MVPEQTMDAARRRPASTHRRRLPPPPGRCAAGLEPDWEQVQCTLRIPPADLDELRALAARYATSNGGAVMIMLDALHALAARNGIAGGIMVLLDALLRDITPSSGLKPLR